MSDLIVFSLVIVALVGLNVATDAWESRLRAENTRLRALLKLAQSVHSLRDAMDRRGVPPAPTGNGGRHD